MSSFAYGMLTLQRASQPKEESKSTGKPGFGSYVDVVAALVPAEVLAMNAVLIPRMTKTTSEASGHPVTEITEPTALKVLFAISVVLSIALYVLGRYRQTKGSSKRFSA